MNEEKRNLLRETKGIVTNIQRYSLHDGPGLRTNVFFKGCALHCSWCSNPEAIQPQPEIAFFEQYCFLCGECVSACPQSAITTRDQQIQWDRLKCNQSGRCVDVCPSHAFTIIGREMTAREVMTEVLRDAAFYSDHGGVTLTGGEPTLQPQFAEAVLRLSKEEGFHTAIETCGAVGWQNIKRLLPHLDLVLFDLKHTDPTIHRRFTGSSNLTILENLRKTTGSGAKVIVRIPLIPDFNADKESLIAIAKFVQSLRVVNEVHLLAYHTLGKSKYHALGLPYPMENYPPMQQEEAEKWSSIFTSHGISVQIGG